MALVTIQRSPSPSNSPESEEDLTDGDKLGRQRRSKSTLKKLRKLFNTVRFITKCRPRFSENYFAVKGAALILPQSEYTRKASRHGGDIQCHLQSMFYLLRPEDTIKVAVKLESVYQNRNRYMAVVSCMGTQDTEESMILGIDCNEKSTIGQVLPIWAHTQIKLDGDGGFSIKSEGRDYIFKPVSVQAMWSALQSLHKVVQVANNKNYIPTGITHTWVCYYKAKIESDSSCMKEWNFMEDVESFATDSPFSLLENDCDEAGMKLKIKAKLKEVLMMYDLEETTSKEIRIKLEEELQRNLHEYKKYIDQELIRIVGQLDAPAQIYDYLYLGSEWNASNYEELVENKVNHILNVSREIDNFFPEQFHYLNIREFDNEQSDLMKHWKKTYEFISNARDEGSKVLVHCRMGVSRSASTVIAYVMKESKCSLDEAFKFVKERRSCIRPNSAFMKQLEEYHGILTASNQRYLFSSKSNSKGHDIDFEGEPITEEQYFQTEEESQGAYSVDAQLPDSMTKEDLDFLEENAEYLESKTASDSDSLSSVDTEVDMLSDEFSLGQLVPQSTSPHESKYIRSSVSDAGSTASSKFKADNSWIHSDTSVTSDTKFTEEGQVCTLALPFDSSPGEAVTESKTLDLICEKQPDELMDTSAIDFSDIEVPEPYIKEAIPWHPGTVRKQKQDLEQRIMGKCQSETKALDGNIENAFMKENESASEAECTKIDDEKLTQAAFESVSTQSNIGLKLSQSLSALPLDHELVESEVETRLRPQSVYEIESIDLPPGLVKRATQELEEKQKITEPEASNAGTFQEDKTKPIQRSSSLKSERVTPKIEQPERRKTCTPILSPTCVSPNLSHESSPEPSRIESSEGESQAPMESMEVEGNTANLTEYQYGTEKIQIKGGSVKQKAMDFESKTAEEKQKEWEAKANGDGTSGQYLAGGNFPDNHGVSSTDINAGNEENFNASCKLATSPSSTAHLGKLVSEKDLPGTEEQKPPPPDFSMLKLLSVSGDKLENMETAAEKCTEVPSTTGAVFKITKSASHGDLGLIDLSVGQKKDMDDPDDAGFLAGSVTEMARRLEEKSKEKDGLEKDSTAKFFTKDGKSLSESDSAEVMPTTLENLTTNLKVLKGNSSVIDAPESLLLSGEHLPRKCVAEIGVEVEDGQKGSSEKLCTRENIEGNFVRCLVGKFDPSKSKSGHSDSIQKVDTSGRVKSPPLESAVVPSATTSIPAKEEVKTDMALHLSSSSETDTALFSLPGKPQPERSNLLLPDLVTASKMQPVARPKSAKQSQRKPPANPGRAAEMSSLLQTQASLEGRKVRKLHGKSHPLSKLDTRQYSLQRSTNPSFYSTM